MCRFPYEKKKFLTNHYTHKHTQCVVYKKKYIHAHAHTHTHVLLDSLEPRITQSVRELGDLLIGIKGGGNLTNTNQAAQRNAVAVEADEVLRPLMDLLDGSLTLYAQSCEKTVLKRLLKELWKIVMRILEKTIVLPPMNDRTVSVSYPIKSNIFAIFLSHR